MTEPRREAGVKQDLHRLARRFRDDRSGATSIEYSLVASLIFLAVVGSITAFGGSMADLFDFVVQAITAAIGGG